MGPSVMDEASRRRFMTAVPAAGATIVLFAVLLHPAVPQGVRETASGAGLVVAGLAATLSCGLAARRSTGRRSRSWQLLMAAAIVALAGNLWVTAAGGDPADSPHLVSDISIAVALLLSIVGVLNFPSARRRGLDLIVMGLDGLVMGSAVLIIASVLVFDEVWGAGGGELGEAWLTLLIPLLDVVLVTVALLMFQRLRGTAGSALVLVAAGFLMYAVSDLSYAALVADGRFEFGTFLDLGWIAGYLLIAVAATYPTPDADEQDHETSGETIDTVVVFGVLVAAAVVQTVFDDGTQDGVQLAMLLLLVLAAGLRQTLLVADNAALRRGLEQRVREQTADLRRLVRQTEVLLSSVGDGIYGVDADGRITFVNPPGAAALGYEPDQLLGRHAHETLHARPADLEDGAPFPYEGCYVYEAIHAGVVSSAEEDVYRRADGERLPVEITASPLVDEDVVRGAVVVFRDVTQRQEVDRMKNEFLSVVSHELRTPLTSIRGSLGLLASGALGRLEPRGQSLATIALESSERLTRLINDILDLERIRVGSRPMDLVPLDAEELVRASVAEMSQLARAHDVRVEVGTVTGRVLADRDRIVQTLTNLLGNSMKFSEPGSVVTVEAVHQGHEVLFSVRDRGRGIPQDSLEAVFERFHQVDSSDARQKGGTGLGLAISRGIVERHGGRIWAESPPGEGALISFTLPCAEHASGEHAASGEPVVLVCGEEPEVAGRWADMLGRHGFRAEHVTPGDVVEQADRDRPAAVLLAPDAAGAGDVVGELARGRRTRRIPVVVVADEVADKVADSAPADAAGEVPGGGSGSGARPAGRLVGPVSEQRLAAALTTALAGRAGTSTVLLVQDDAAHARSITARLASHGLHVAHAGTAAQATRLGADLPPRVVVLDARLPDVPAALAELRRSPALAEAPVLLYGSSAVANGQRAQLHLDGTTLLTVDEADPGVLEDRVLDVVDAMTGPDDEGHL